MLSHRSFGDVNDRADHHVVLELQQNVVTLSGVLANVALADESSCDFSEHGRKAA